MNNNITEGSINKSIWMLAIPAIMSTFSNVIFDLTNAYWIGKAGTQSMAALTMGSFIVWAMYSLTAIGFTGTTALIARRVGEGEPEKVRVAAHQALLVTLLIALFVGTAMFFIAPLCLQSQQHSDKVASLALQYAKIFAVGSIPIFLLHTVEAIFRGQGDNKTALYLILLAVAINCVLDPILIFGYGPFPKMDLPGAAIASVIAQSVSFLVGLALLIKKGWIAPRIKNFFPINWHVAKTIVSIGLPHGATGFFFSVIYVLLGNIIGMFGHEPMAALGLGHRLESFVYFTLVGFSVSCTTLVGQNLGAGKPERAEACVWRTCLFATIFTCCYTIIFFWQAPFLVSIFTSDPLVQMHGQTYLRIMAFVMILFGFEIVLEGAFAGAGNTLPPMIIITAGTSLRLPIAFILAFHYHWGAMGVWLAISSSIFLKAVAIIFWFRKGLWKNKKI